MKKDAKSGWTKKGTIRNAQVDECIRPVSATEKWQNQMNWIL